MKLWRTIRTIFDLAARVQHVEIRQEEVELEWLDKKDAFERLLKRLAVREARWRVDQAEGETGHGPTVEPNQTVTSGLDSAPTKAQLRRLARERGLIR